MEVSAFINSSSSDIIDIGILRNDSEITFSVKPEVIKGEDSLGNKANKKIIGIKIAPLNDEINRERLGPATALFYAFEKVLGRPLTQKTQEGFFRIGLFLLLSLMFFTTFNDLRDLGLF